MRSSPASSTTAPPTSRAAKPSARLPARQQKSEIDPSPTLTRQFDSLCPSYLVVCAVCAKCESSVQLVCRAVSGCDARAVGAGVVRSWLLTHSKLRNLTPPITTSHPGLRTPPRSIRGGRMRGEGDMRTAEVVPLGARHTSRRPHDAPAGARQPPPLRRAETRAPHEQSRRRAPAAAAEELLRGAEAEAVLVVDEDDNVGVVRGGGGGDVRALELRRAHQASEGNSYAARAWSEEDPTRCTRTCPCRGSG